MWLFMGILESMGRLQGLTFAKVSSPTGTPVSSACKHAPLCLGSFSDQEPEHTAGTKCQGFHCQPPTCQRVDVCSQPELKAYERAKASATASLALRSQSRQQLFEKLTERGYDPRVVHRALDRLQDVVSISA